MAAVASSCAAPSGAAAKAAPGFQARTVVAGAIDSENVVTMGQPDASLTVTVKPNAPPCVGVPAIAPVAGSRARPAGRLPVVTANVNGGVPKAGVGTVAEYDAPTVVAGSVAVTTGRLPVTLWYASAARPYGVLTNQWTMFWPTSRVDSAVTTATPSALPQPSGCPMFALEAGTLQTPSGISIEVSAGA